MTNDCVVWIFNVVGEKNLGEVGLDWGKNLWLGRLGFKIESCVIGRRWRSEAANIFS